MPKASRMVALFAFLAVAVGLAGCQQSVQAPTLESGQAKELLDTWNNNGKKLMEMAEDFSADKYGFRPTKEIRSFGEIIRHVAAVTFRYVRLAQGREYNAEEFAMENFKTKADLAALLKSSYEEGATLIGQVSDAQMVEAVKNPYNDSSLSRYAYWMQAVEHAAEHYGNLVVYYRVNGLVPPASRPRDQQGTEAGGDGR